MKLKLLALALVILVSCGNNSAKNEMSEDQVSEDSTTEVMNDSDHVAAAAAEEEEEEEEEEKVQETEPEVEEKPVKQEPTVLPAGTILFIKTTKDIYAESFAAGDHFFVELAKDITSKGKVVIPRGTIVQMEVVVSENKKRRSSQFAVTVGGFIVDNFLQKVTTETKAVKTEDMAGGTLKKAAIGAGVGAAFDGGSGAGKGAAVGGAVGLLKKGQKIHFPAGTEGTFQLTEALTVSWL